jgi:hypothetical protein
VVTVEPSGGSDNTESALPREDVKVTQARMAFKWPTGPPPPRRHPNLSQADMSPAPSSTVSFSLVAGGPSYRLQQRVGLIKQESPYLVRRAAFSVLITWFPLLILSAVEGLAIGHRVRIPLLYDFAAYARSLVAIPVLILAEGPIEWHLTKVAAHFLHAGLVPEDRYPDYESALKRAARRRDSVLAEVVLLGLALVSAFVVHNEFPFNFPTWRSIVVDSTPIRTWAGWWYLCVTTPVFQFLFWRWLWRLFIWYEFLWRMCRLDLRLIPTHPDREAGLGFVGDGQRFFWTIIVAYSVAAAGVLSNEILFAGVSLRRYEFALAGYVVVVLVVFLGPLLMFAPALIKAKLESLHDYGAFAVTHNLMFDGKWVQGANPKGEPALGTPDISSLADLGNAYEVLDRMRPIPFDPSDAIVLALAAVVPMAPLLLTIMPLGQIIDFVSKTLI